jgi:hypothetical protein
MNGCTLALFARVPRIGAVKRRLIPAFAPAGACAVYEVLLRHALRAGSAVPDCRREFWWTDDSLQSPAPPRVPGWTVIAQAGADLGARMHRVFVEAWRRGEAAIVYGADCPFLSARELFWAAQRLANGDDAVLAPVLDGGYALVGLRRPCAAIFEHQDWGGSAVAAVTRRRWRALGLRWSELPYAWDVDRPVDVERLLALRVVPDLAGALAGVNTRTSAARESDGAWR